MSTTVMDRQNVDIVVIAAAVDLLIFDAQVREMNLVVEVRQVVLACPFLNLIRVASRSSITVAIPFVQPLLVVALELVIQDDSIDARTTLGELLGLSKVSVEDLTVVLDFTRLDKARVELLGVIALPVAVRVQQIATTISEHHNVVPPTGDGLSSDQSLFAQVAEVTGPWIGGPVVVAAKVTSGHYSKGANCRERPCFGTAEGVLTVAVVPHCLPFPSPRQVEVAYEDVARIDVVRVAIPLRPAFGIAVA